MTAPFLGRRLDWGIPLASFCSVKNGNLMTIQEAGVTQVPVFAGIVKRQVRDGPKKEGVI